MRTINAIKVIRPSVFAVRPGARDAGGFSSDSPGLGLASGHALPQPLGVRGEVVDELPADLIRGLDGVSILWDQQGGEREKLSEARPKWKECEDDKTMC